MGASPACTQIDRRSGAQDVQRRTERSVHTRGTSPESGGGGRALLLEESLPFVVREGVAAAPDTIPASEHDHVKLPKPGTASCPLTWP